MDITLALGGGGVKGFAHIGVIRILEAEGYRILGIAGTSAGGLVGALYASGYSPDEMEARLVESDQGSLFARMHGDGPALLGLAGVTAILIELLGERTFADLRLPLALTATDLTSRKDVVIKQGRLVDAVLATSAVPGIFPAVSLDGHVLVDGAIMSPIPVAEARKFSPDSPVMAVILSPPPGWIPDNQNGNENGLPIPLTNIPLLYRLAGRLRLTQAFNIFIQSMDLTGLALVEKQLAIERPAVVIRPEVSQIGIIDRVDIPAVVKLGELATRKVLPEIRRSVGWQQRLKSRLSHILSAQQDNRYEP